MPATEPEVRAAFASPATKGDVSLNAALVIALMMVAFFIQEYRINRHIDERIAPCQQTTK